MGQIRGYATIYSGFCNNCEAVSLPDTTSETFSSTEVFCRTCSGPLWLHVQVNPEIYRTNIAIPIRVTEMVSNFAQYSSDRFSFLGEWRKILNVEQSVYKPGKVDVAIEKCRVENCDPDDLFLKLHGGWHNNWCSHT